MLFGKIVAPIALGMALLAPTLASAQEVNRSLAANPDAVMAELEAMNLTPLSDEVAGEIKGGIWWVNIATGYVANWWSDVFGTDIRFTLWTPLTVCAPTTATTTPATAGC